MQINLDQIRDHEAQRMADAPPEASERIASFKRFLKLENDRLRMRHRFGLGGREIAQGRSYLTDLVVSRACQMAASDLGPASRDDLSACAIVALGGYGRRELAPCSDVDLLFLCPDKPVPAVIAFVEKVLLLLWDVGLQVGHSFRTVPECVSMAREDLHSRNAMSEARLVTGNQGLFQRFESQLQSSVYDNRRATDGFLQSMRREIEERLERFGGTVCVQEPNVKEGAGGLRDFHTVVWLGHGRFGFRGLEQLLAGGIVAAGEHATALRAYDFVARVRNEAHFATNRRSDQLALDLQPTVATGLGYVDKDGSAASETFMRDYYRRAQELRRFCESFLLRAGVTRPLPRFRFRRKAVGPRGRYEVREGRLYPRGRTHEFSGNPLRLMEVFQVAQDQGVRVGEELRLAVHNSLRLVGRSFRASQEASQAFLNLLDRPGRVASSLREMHETGFLGRYLPEFERITFVVQHDFYHRYTVEEHTLKALDGIDRLATSAEPELEPFARALKDVKSHATLTLGMLLHDIGKGHGGEHVVRGTRIAERMCERLKLDPSVAADAIFLVQKHLVMSHVSQRRDLSDETLIAGFVGTVTTLDRLNMLSVLTFADTNAVGPGVWNDWKAALQLELYAKTRAHFVGTRPDPWNADRRARVEERVLPGLLPEFLRSDVERHLALFPDRYLRVSTPDQIAAHFRMVRELGQRALKTDWRAAASGRPTVLAVCARDAQGLLARLAGTLTGNGLSILNVDAFTLSDGLVLDIFRLCLASDLGPVPQERWPAIESDLVAALEGRHDVDAAVLRWHTSLPRRTRRKAPSPPVVRFESSDAGERTVVEVRADDEPGLVYRIAGTLAQLGLNISLAKIATEKTQALDVFYVARADGRALEGHELPGVESALLSALDAKAADGRLKEAQ